MNRRGQVGRRAAWGYGILVEEKCRLPRDLRKTKMRLNHRDTEKLAPVERGRDARDKSNPYCRGLTFMFTLLLALVVSNCKRTISTPVSTSQPISRAVAIVPSTLSIDGLMVPFPPVTLRTQSTGGGLAVAIAAPSTGASVENQIDFDVTLEDVDDPTHLAGAAWQFHSDEAGRVDTLNRITLTDPHAVLEPADVHILFGSDRERDTVEIDGEFRWYEPPDAATPLKTVHVTGRIFAK